MEDLKKFFIDGKWIIPNLQTYFLIDPSNEKIFAEIILGNKRCRNCCLCQKSFQYFSSFSKGDRLKLLENYFRLWKKDLKI